MSDQLDTTRPMVKADWQEIFRRLEDGASREAVAEVYGISVKTINKRLSAERPKLWEERFKAMTTSVRIEADPQKRAMALFAAMAREFKLDAATIATHDFKTFADKARKQQEDKLSDPQVQLTPVAMQDAKALASLTKIMQALPEMGLASGGTNVSVTTNLNHATLMRRGDDKGVLASEDDIAGAIVDAEIEP